MRGSSVHFKPIDSAVHAVTHANREMPPSYLLPADMTFGTVCVLDDLGTVAKTLSHKLSLASRQAKASKDYSPLWEGVINLRRPEQNENPDSYKKECADVVKDWCKKYEAMTGHRVLRADVHLDEGHIVNDEVLLNAHAHVMADKTNSLGRVLKMTPQKLRELQTVTAVVTGLERGINSRISGKKHINAHQYKYLAERGRLENQTALDGEKAKSKEEIARVRALGLQWSNEDAAKLKAAKLEAAKVPALESQISQQADEIVKLNEQYRIARQELKDSGTAKQSDYQALKKQHEAALVEISQLKKRMDVMTKENQELRVGNEKLRAENERLEASARRTLKTLERDFGADVSAGDKLRGSELNDFCNAVEDQVFEKQMAERTQTPKQAFLGRYTGVETVEVHRIDGARLDAAEGRLGLFTWPNRATGGRNEALCQVPDNKVMPMLGECFDSRAVPGRGRGGRAD